MNLIGPGFRNTPRRLMMRRLLLPPIAALVLVGVAACGSDDAGSAETLPPIRTTSTVSTTTTTLNTNRRFYTVKPGENLNLIARSFDVPLKALIDLNRSILPDPDNVPAGVTLEIPSGVEMIDDLPTTSTTGSTEP